MRDGEEVESVMYGLRTRIGARRTPDFRDEVKSNYYKRLHIYINNYVNMVVTLTVFTLDWKQ